MLQGNMTLTQFQYIIVQMYKDSQSKNNNETNEFIEIEQNQIVEDDTELEEEVIITNETDSTNVSSVKYVEELVVTNDKQQSNDDNIHTTNTETK